ncbi:MAG: hypothetical protein Q9201_007059 [Fulgogasparrea decipioides]
MPQLLRRKLDCFYCNRRSAQDRKAGIRQWQCEQCDAINYLDENGEITDPPTQDCTSARYTQYQPRPVSPETSPLERSLFCQRCIQNQHIVNQALAEYLPAQDDPRYPEFERAFPAYQKKMEDRFPQVCEDCAPAVMSRIRDTGYAAKADNLRRVNDRSRNASTQHRSWSWKNSVVLLGATGWSMGLVGQLAWHIVGASLKSQAEDGLVDEEATQTVVSCLYESALNFQARRSCNDLLQQLPAYALGLSLLCFWWNPMMQYKLRGGCGRIIGSIEYYKLQLIALAVRFLSWKLATKEPTLFKDPQTSRALHALSLVLQIMLITLAFRSIRLDQRPIVSFQENHELSVPTQSQSTSTATSHQNIRDLSPPPRPRIDSFLIEKLAPRAEQPSYQPPTPPPEEDEAIEDNIMDWTPQHNFRPATTYHAPQSRPVFNEPSPFHGVIPPAPVSWAQRLRNPPNQPSFRKASETKRETLFPGKKNKRVISDAASDVSGQFSPVSHRDTTSEIESPVKFADPKFFAPNDLSETGLESLFGDTFSLGRELTEDASRQGPDERQMVMPSPYKPFGFLIAAVLLGVSCGIWDLASSILPGSEAQIRFLILLVPASVSARNVILSTSRSLSSIVVSAASIALAVYIGMLVYYPLDHEGQERIGALGFWYLLALTAWEGWGFISNLATPSPVGQTEAMHQEPLPQKEASQPPIPRPKNSTTRTPTINTSTTPTISTIRNPNTIALSQHTMKQKAYDEKRRDSLGDGLGGLSLGGQ